MRARTILTRVPGLRGISLAHCSKLGLKQDGLGPWLLQHTNCHLLPASLLGARLARCAGRDEVACHSFIACADVEHLTGTSNPLGRTLGSRTVEAVIICSTFYDPVAVCGWLSRSTSVPTAITLLIAFFHADSTLHVLAFAYLTSKSTALVV